MTDFTTSNGASLLTGASDADNDSLVAYRINGSVISTWPHVVTLTYDTATVYQNGRVDLTEATDTNNPNDTESTDFGVFTYTLWDGQAESNTSNYTVRAVGQATPSAPGYVTNGLIARWDPDEGVTTSGGFITEWEDQENGIVLTANGSPSLGTPPGGTATNTVMVNSESNFTATSVTTLPSSASPRTIQMIWKPSDVMFYGGFGYGTDTANRSFVLACNAGEEVTVDYYSLEVGSGLTSDGNTWLVHTATYDGATIKFYLGDVLIASATVALNTSTAFLNVCKSFSGYTMGAEFGPILVYGRELNSAERLTNSAYLNSKVIGSTSVTSPDTPTESAVGDTGFTVDVTTNTDYCYVAYSVRTSSTPATESEIIAGTSALQYGIIVSNGVGSVSIPVTGATASTGYYANVVVYGLTGGVSSVVTSSVITTTAAPSDPVLSSATFTATGQTTAVGTVSTDTGNGTLEYGIMLSSATTPDIDQLELGTDGDDVALIGGLRTKAITASGSQTVSITGLTAGTSYKIVYAQRNVSSQPSNVVTATDTTDASTVTTDYTPDSTSATTSGVNAILAAWEADWNGTTPAGKTNSDKRVVQLTANAGAWTVSGYDFSAYPGVIVRGIGPYSDGVTYPYNPVCGTHLSGKLTINSCNNIEFYGFSVYKLEPNNSPNLTFRRLSIQSRWDTSATSPQEFNPILITNCPNATFDKCHSSGWKTSNLRIRDGCDDLLVEKCYFEKWADDLIKFVGTGTLNRTTVSRCWLGRENLGRYTGNPSNSSHTDFVQNQQATTDNWTHYGNFHISGISTGPENNLNTHACLWQSNSNVANNCVATQNIFAISGNGGINKVAGSAGLNDNNTLLYYEKGQPGSLQYNSGAPGMTGSWSVSKQNNFTTRQQTQNPDTGGTNSVVFTVGYFGSGAVPVVATLGEYATYFEGVPGTTTDIHSVKPKVGTPAHWNYSGTKIGAYLRSQEIWEGGIHPGNDGWPCAGRFHDEYDPNNLLGSNYSGVYNDDAENFVASPTAVTVNNLALTVYDSDPHGIDAAAITFSGTQNLDGSDLQIKIVQSSDDSTVVDWTNFTAGAGGVWSTTVNVPRNGFNESKAIVRARYDTSVTATQSTGFYVGYNIGWLGQSLIARPLNVAASTVALAPPAKTLFVQENAVNGSPGLGQREVVSNSNLNRRRMAVTVREHFDAPVCIVDFTHSGTGFGQMVNASETDGRSWNDSVLAAYNPIKNGGSDISIVLWHWFTYDAAVLFEAERWMMPGLTKQALSGLGDTGDGSGLTPYNGASVNVVPSHAYVAAHYLWDLNGTGQGLFDVDRTRFVVMHGHAFYGPSAEGAWAAGVKNKAKFANGQAEACASGVGFSKISLANVSGWTGRYEFGGHLAQPNSTHVNDTSGEEDGEALVGVYLIIASARACGCMLADEPRITAVTDNSTYWDVTVSLPHGGDLSTPLIEHGAGSYAGSFEATYWTTPTNLDENDIPQLHTVQGFSVWTGSSADWTNFTAEIQDTGTGTVPNRTGTIRITPSGGSTAGKTLGFGEYDGVNLLTLSDALTSRVFTHWPIETRTHVSGTGYGYPVVRQSGETTIQTDWP